MRNERGWMTALFILLLAVAYGCQDRPLDTVETAQDPAVHPGEVTGQAHAPMQRNFRANLKGGNEVPAVETNAQGEATFQVSRDGSSIHYRLIAANIDSVLMAHIHNAPAGVNGGVVVWLYPSSPPPMLIEGTFQGVLAEGTITASNLTGSLAGMTLDDLIALMKAGDTYVNVHTKQNPGGEIRGQIF